MILVILFSLFVNSENPQENEVLKPIRMLFQGMEEVDSTIVRKAFTDKPNMYTVLESDQGTKLNVGDFERFLSFIGTPRDKFIAEPIWDIKIDQDGDLAQVWAKYALYVDGNVNHCGVDAFQLVKLNGEWKIFTITDTRHKENCVIPDDVKKRYGN